MKDSKEVTCFVTVGEKTQEFNCTPEELYEGVVQYANGALIQNAFDFLTPDEREFLMTGITPEEWDKMFPPEED